MGQKKLKIGLAFWTLPQSPIDFFFCFFFLNKRLGFWNSTSKPKIEKKGVGILTVPQG